MEDARLLSVDLDDPRLALAVVVGLDPVRLAHRPTGVELPVVGVELGDERRDPLLVVPVGEVGAEGAAADVGGVGVDALAPLAEDARVGRGQPRQVAAEHLGVVSGVGELDERAGEDQVDFGHARA